MNLTDLLAALEALNAKAYPDGPQVIIDGDDWRGHLVVKLSDVHALVQRLGE